MTRREFFRGAAVASAAAVGQLLAPPTRAPKLQNGGFIKSDRPVLARLDINCGSIDWERSRPRQWGERMPPFDGERFWPSPVTMWWPERREDRPA